MSATAMPHDVARWDAMAEYDVGVMLVRYLQDHPAPPGSRVAPGLAAAARDLRAAGERDLDYVGQRRLQVAGRDELVEQARALLGEREGA